MDSEAQVDDRPPRHLLVVDCVVSIILLVVQPVVAIVLFFLAALAGSSSFHQTQSVPQWAVTTVIVLVFAVPLVAAVFTIARMVNDRVLGAVADHGNDNPDGLFPVLVWGIALNPVGAFPLTN
ncbi:hypothetical protein [Paeniglutamicibacter sulfureus]|uniref:Uncharacterized protein YqgC (DUF456 family) n=1 Tax=Paeniglutamicibacter sulfureus TaxID=43666 RepID=A0ABU2BNS7_9MICC|nr:hypothetical protein [Paeniglutamicibacter sulfureus]MDR7360285.1 uncharacterized protein YqgC (DUF456 family) [Paeniglutamicibacter sulfureus]